MVTILEALNMHKTLGEIFTTVYSRFEFLGEFAIKIL